MALAVGGVFAASGVAHAQERATLTFSGSGAYVWVRDDGSAPAVQRRGPVLAGEGRVSLRGVTLAASLLEGQLQDVGSSSQRDLVEARVIVAGRPLPWLELSVGPVVRAYVADSTTERWVFWQARARVSAPIVATRLSSYFELWRALSSQVNLVTAPGRVQGGEAGVVYRPPRGTVWVRLGYRIDDAALRAVGSETLEAVTFSVGMGEW